MDESILNIAIFLAATFAATLVTGLAGFAFGLAAAAVWLHILSPLQTATLIIAFGSRSAGRLGMEIARRFAMEPAVAIPCRRGVGGTVGRGGLGWARPDHVRVGVGVLLILFSTYSLARPAIKPVTAGGALADAGVGFADGILGSLTGLAGILTTIWCGLRGWPRDQQRTVFQPIGVAIFAMSALWLGASGALSPDIVWLFVIGLPAVLLGTWVGLKLFGRLNEAGFRKVVQRATTQIDLSGMKAGIAPEDFAFSRTGGGDVGEWRVIDDPTASNRRVIAQTSTDTTDYRFPLAVYQRISAKNVDVKVRFKPVGGKVDQAGGIIVRLATPDDYYVVRANALEDNVRFYRVVKGKREQIKGANTKVASNIWHTLGLRAEGDRFTVSFDGKELYTAQDNTFSGSGKVGLWTKADSVTYFDAIAITPLE